MWFTDATGIRRMSSVVARRAGGWVEAAKEQKSQTNFWTERIKGACGVHQQMRKFGLERKANKVRAEWDGLDPGVPGIPSKFVIVYDWRLQQKGSRGCDGDCQMKTEGKPIPCDGGRAKESFGS